MRTGGLFRIAGIILVLAALLSASCSGGESKPKTYSASPPMTSQIQPFIPL